MSRGRAWTPEQRAKASESHKGVPLSPEHHMAISKSEKGKPLSAEHRAAVDAGRKGRKHSAETRAKMSAAHKGKTLTQEHRDKIGKAHKGVPQPPLSEEHRAKLSVTSKRMWADRDEATKCRIISRVNTYNGPTSIELLVAQELFDRGISFEPEARIGWYRVDFLIGQLVIECDGEYWHPVGNKRDARKDAYLERKGYVVVRLRENDIRADVTAQVSTALACR